MSTLGRTQIVHECLLKRLAIAIRKKKSKHLINLLLSSQIYLPEFVNKDQTCICIWLTSRTSNSFTEKNVIKKILSQSLLILPLYEKAGDGSY